MSLTLDWYTQASPKPRTRVIHGDNQYQALGSTGFSAICSGERNAAGTDVARHRAGVHFWADFWRGDGVCGDRGGADGGGVDSDCGAVDQRAAGAGAGVDSGEQYCPDDGERGAVDCSGGDLHAAGADFSGIRSRILSYFCAGDAGRVAGTAVHDPAAAAADCGGARKPDVSRGDGMRGCAAGRGAGRVVREPGVSWAGVRRTVHAVPERQHFWRVAGHAELRTGPGEAAHPEGWGDPRGCGAGVSGGGVHHWGEGGGDDVCRRRVFVGWC